MGEMAEIVGEFHMNLGRTKWGSPKKWKSDTSQKIKSREIIRIMTLRFKWQQMSPVVSIFFAEIIFVNSFFISILLVTDYIPRRCGYQPCIPKQEQSRHRGTGRHRSVCWSASRTLLFLSPGKDTDSGLRVPMIARNTQQIPVDILEYELLYSIFPS